MPLYANFEPFFSLNSKLSNLQCRNFVRRSESDSDFCFDAEKKQAAEKKMK